MAVIVMERRRGSGLELGGAADVRLAKPL